MTPARPLRLLLLLPALLLGCPEPEPEPELPPIVDPLSRPAEPTLSSSSFRSAEECAECHRQHYAEWRTSMHAYSMKDPVFRALVGVRRADFDGEQDSFCLQCHSAIGTRSREIRPNFDWDALSPVVLEGVTCEACHKVASIERTWNSGHVLEEDGPIRGPIQDPESVGFHEVEYSPIFDTSAFCGGCHDVIELNGLNLERPYAEWLESPAREEGRNCQSCHMPEYRGSATIGGTTERTLHRHRFVGVDLPLLPGTITEFEEEELRAEVEALLDGAATLSLDAPAEAPAGSTFDLLVTVRNDIDGHNFPTGSTFIRQAWVELTARDAEGTLLYATGDLDDNGDLRDAWSELDPYGDSDLLRFGSGLTNAVGAPELFPWRAIEHHSTTLSPGYDRTATLFIPTAEAVGPVTIEARLRFRTHPPFLLRALGLDDLIPRIGEYEVDATSAVVELR